MSDSDWDDDAFDPTAQISNKIVSLGLDDHLKKDKDEKIESTTTIKSKHDDGPSIFDLKPDHELTEAEKRDAQLKSDAVSALDLFGLSEKRDENVPTLSKLQGKDELLAYAEGLGEEIVKKSDNTHYLDFVNALMDRIARPMKKIQLETLDATINKHLDKFKKKEEIEISWINEQKDVKKSKKEQRKKLQEDVIEDEYDDYVEKYY